MNRSGQTLTILLVFTAIAITITTAAVAVVIANSQSSLNYDLGSESLAVAESGAENGVLRLLRDLSYTGETLTVGNGTATITVTGSGPYTLVSTGRVGNFLRQVSLTVANTSGVLSVTSWRETYP